MDSDDYAYEENKMSIDEINRLEDDMSPKTPVIADTFGSTLHIPISKFKMIGQQEEEKSPSSGNFMIRRR